MKQPLRRSNGLVRRGHTYVEVAMSTLIVALLLLASLQVCAQSVLTQRIMGEQAVGHLLADSLLAEIGLQAYADPQSPTAPLGADSGESTRAALDDVDDYHNLVESPPGDRLGNVAANLGRWSRRVTVQWVDNVTFSIPSATETGAKSIVVEALFDGQVIASATRIKTNVP